jgi:hypothetical protein
LVPRNFNDQVWQRTRIAAPPTPAANVEPMHGFFRESMEFAREVAG